MATYKILYWHDIPSQVRTTDENGRVSKQLSDRFLMAIDNAAMALGLVGSDEYTDGFQWGEQAEHPGTAEETAEAVVAELERKYQRIDWRAVASKLEDS